MASHQRCLFVFTTLFAYAHTYCWGIGRNPTFNAKPKVQQVDIETVRVSWYGIVEDLECADQFTVKYWQAATPMVYETTELLPPTTFATDIKVIPRIEYEFQVIAREDKALGVDYNRSPNVKFRTSRHTTNLPPRIYADLPLTGQPEEAANHVDDYQAEALDTQDTYKSIILVAFVVGGVLLGLLVFAGFAYLICRNMDSNDDSEEYNLNYSKSRKRFTLAKEDPEMGPEVKDSPRPGELETVAEESEEAEEEKDS